MKRDAVGRDSGVDEMVHNVMLDKNDAPITSFTDKEDFGVSHYRK